MLPDSEVLAILCEALTALEVGDFTVKVYRFFFPVIAFYLASDVLAA